MHTPEPFEIDVTAHGLDVAVLVQEPTPEESSGISWSAVPTGVGMFMIICLIAPDGSRMTAQLDEHQLHAMATDMAQMVRAMPPRPESERTLQ